jgi:hydroxymethylglutaryl-CoA reductase (NADPH)
MVDYEFLYQRYPISIFIKIRKNMQTIRSANLPKDREDDFQNEIIKERLDFLGNFSNSNLEPLGQYSVDPKSAKGNIENIIGFTQTPVGVVGPIKINGENASGEFYVPMSTLEGALISSYNRGAKVISLSGGVNVVSLQDTIQRAPFFLFKNIIKAKEFIGWFRDNLNLFQEIVKTTTNHGMLHNFKTFLIGKSVYLRLEFNSGDAMGMNMITKATGKICEFIADNFEIENYVIESNMAVDKKPSYINMILGRGKSISAEVRIPEKLVRRFLQTTPQAMVDNYRGQMVGNTLAGVTGCTYHFANGIAAMFLACGQDIANVAESSVGVINLEVLESDLYVSIYLPSLVVGTIGGGTGLPTQKSCLELLGCYGNGKAKKFAEIVAGTLLAGEISLAAAISAGDFIHAHEKYGRNRPTES